MISQPVLVWSAIVLLMIVAFAIRAIEKIRMSHSADKRRHRFIEMAKERELFYCPGDEWLEREINE